MRLSTSGLLVTALKTGTSEAPSLSIIMPAYNERPTVAAALTAVLEKEVVGIARKEIIVVESNSTDGTRDVVRSFEGRPGLKVIYEEAPKGKGHAVRAGFEHATGDIVIIQDADTEYDINDYDELLQPLLRWRQLFVLGSRHQGDWKMRTFTDDPAMSALFNFGQVLFTWLMNTLYQQNMTDPFTMYKVFRRECLFGLSFECNRFDFDHEIVIKFLRKGYRPFEVPVNYCSRSYSEGKKVTIIGDPLLWIKANFKFRVISPFKPMRQAYREARQQMSKGKAKPRVKGEAMTAAHVIDFSITDDSAIIAATLNENQSSTPVGQTTVSEAKS
jgi:glycosyltransferase involved in cell wall biosynthesis